MGITESNSQPETEVERLLSSLAGIVSARVVTNALGHVDEIHVLASDALHPKQVVRNIESALSAGLGLEIDRRMVSVAQVRADQVLPPAPAAHVAAPTELRGAAPPVELPPQARLAELEAENPPLVPLLENRFVFVGYDVRNQTNRETVCHVTIGRGREHYTGSGTGASTVLGRAQAAARAFFSAFATARESEGVLFENAAVVEAHGRTYVLVSAHAQAGRKLEPLTGLAVLQRAPEEAAVLAGLQAVNRWASEDE